MCRSGETSKFGWFINQAVLNTSAARPLRLIVLSCMRECVCVRACVHPTTDTLHTHKHTLSHTHAQTFNHYAGKYVNHASFHRSVRLNPVTLTCDLHIKGDLDSINNPAIDDSSAIISDDTNSKGD